MNRSAVSRFQRKTAVHDHPDVFHQNGIAFFERSGIIQIENDAKVRTEQKGTDTALFQDRKTARRTSVKLVDEFFAQAKALQDVLPKLSTTPDNQIDSLLPPFWKPESKLFFRILEKFWSRL